MFHFAGTAKPAVFGTAHKNKKVYIPDNTKKMKVNTTILFFMSELIMLNKSDYLLN